MDSPHMPTIVAYLDVLGFSSYTEMDLAGAISVLSHQRNILDQKLVDGRDWPAASYKDPGLARVASAHLVDSFLHLLPGSDSTFLVSEEPDKFLCQLSNLLLECLQLVGDAYANTDTPQQPESVEIRDFTNGPLKRENWFPPLWKGGLATGTLQIFPVTGIERHKRVTTSNLAGTAVVKAVRAADTARGPRLFCEAGFEQHFGDAFRPFFRRVNTSMSELLWPAFKYIDGNNPRVDVNLFDDLWRPAVALWKSKKGQSPFEHYDEFLRLLIRSFVAWGDTVGVGNEVKILARHRIQADLNESLIGMYLD